MCWCWGVLRCEMQQSIQNTVCGKKTQVSVRDVSGQVRYIVMLHLCDHRCALACVLCQDQKPTSLSDNVLQQHGTGFQLPTCVSKSGFQKYLRKRWTHAPRDASVNKKHMFLMLHYFSLITIHPVCHSWQLCMVQCSQFHLCYNVLKKHVVSPILSFVTHVSCVSSCSVSCGFLMCPKCM